MLQVIRNNFQKMDKWDKILYSVFFVFSIGYIATLKLRPYPFSSIIKIIPILSLAVLAFRNIMDIKGVLIISGLLFSAIGDFLLALSGREYFIWGLCSFSITHIFYISAFSRNLRIKRPHSFLSIIFISYGVIICSLIFPNVGKMLVPVILYFTLLLLMGISTVLGKNNNLWVIAGAFLFMLSDSLIAINMFTIKLQNSSFWIMSTYYPAQFLLLFGSIQVSIKKNK